jgi:hypothetical protein
MEGRRWREVEGGGGVGCGNVRQGETKRYVFIEMVSEDHI